jgi:hypothetical protein
MVICQIQRYKYITVVLVFTNVKINVNITFKYGDVVLCKYYIFIFFPFFLKLVL